MEGVEKEATARAEFVLGPLWGRREVVDLERDGRPPEVLWRLAGGRRVPYMRLHEARGRGWIYKYEPSVVVS